MTVNPQIAWRPHLGPQMEIMCRSERELSFGGSRGPGKTEALIHWFTDPAFVECSRGTGVVLRKNSKDLKDYIERCRHAYYPINAEIVGTISPIIKFPNGAKIHTGHLQDKKSYEHFQGWEIHRLGVEECTQIAEETTFENMISSVRSTVDNLMPQIFSTANPGGPGHQWYKERYVVPAYKKTFIPNPKAPVNAQLSRIFIPATIDDNPTLVEKDPAYVAWLDNIKDLKQRRAWRFGDWDTFHGQFFEMWSDELICEPFKIPPEWIKYRSLDYGTAKHTAVSWWAASPEGIHYKYREYYQRGKPPMIIAREVLQMTPDDEEIITTYADPSIWAKIHEGKSKTGEQATMQSTAFLFAENGLHCTQANNDRLNGWANFKNMMYHDEDNDPKIQYFNTCRHTIRTMPGLVHSDIKVEDLEKKGSEDHIADADRYYLMHPGITNQIEVSTNTELGKIIDRITNNDKYDEKEEVVWDNF